MVKKYYSFEELSLKEIEPEGWLRRYLEHQVCGLTGNIEAVGYPFNTKGWAAPRTKNTTGEGEDWYPYEQTAYWVDGAIRCGLLLNDKKLFDKAHKQIEYVLNHADSDGYLGPRPFKTTTKPGQWLRWCHVVFFRALMAEYSFGGDSRIVEALARHYLNGTSPYSDGRDVLNIEAMLWTYERTGDPRLLQYAIDASNEYDRLFPEKDHTMKNQLSDKRSKGHGATYNEMAKLGAILYMYTGKKRYLSASINAFRKMDRDQMLIDGIPSSTERLRGKDPLDSHETCDISDYTWSAGYLLMATGEVDYADKLERACFNAAPGAVKNDFKALQYFSCPNQVIADKCSNHNIFYQGSQWMSYRPCPGVECCPGQVNRIMPNYVSRMWMRGKDGGLAATLYGSSRITATVGKKNDIVTVVQETSYPFSDKIDFQIRTDTPVRFSFSLRIPGWCRDARISINGEPWDGDIKSGTFVKINRTFHQNDRVTLQLPMELKLSHWSSGGVGIERGPLVFSLGIQEDWQIDEEAPCHKEKFPPWNLYPASSWNYALAVDEKNLGSVEVLMGKDSTNPWSLQDAPIALKVPARKVKNWRIQYKKVVYPEGEKVTEKRGDFRMTPPLPDPGGLKNRLGDVEWITLVPYGCTHLRMTIFPNAAESGA